MTSHPTTDELMAWRDAEVAKDRAAEIAAHVATCAACTAAVTALEHTSAAIQAWRIDAPPAMASPVRRRSHRRMLYWASAAIVIIGLLSTVRVECAAAAPTCDHPQFHVSFLRSAPAQPAPAFVSSGSGSSGPAAAMFDRDWNARRRVKMGIPTGDEKVLVVMFIDWQCPACRAVHMSYLPVVDAINTTTPGAVRVVTRDFPLNIRCNPNVPVEMHPAACEAAVAVRLARDTHRENELIAWLFANQATLTPAIVRQAAKDVAGVTDLDARYSAVVADVLADVELGRGLEVGSTPTVFINGVLARTADNALFSPEQFAMALAAELKK
jgi:protein-disulfide isomerase